MPEHTHVRIVVRSFREESYRHQIYDGPVGRRAEKVYGGLAHQLDLDRFYIDEEEYTPENTHVDA